MHSSNIKTKEKHPPAPLLRQQLLRWFDQPLGRTLQAVEATQLRHMLPRLFGTVGIQLGCIGKLDLLDACNAPTRILVDVAPCDYPAQVKGEADALPFENKCVDVALLPHTLDFAADPHQILREVQRVLTPEGHVVILGFNPLGLWGLWRLLARRRGHLPWNGNFLGQSRLKDWLSLLDFDISYSTMLYYRPPLQNETIMERLRFLDKLGDRWWPRAGAVYLLVAKKRVVGMMPLQPPWEKKKPAVGGLAEPAAKVIYPRVPQWRLHRGG